MKKFFSVFLAMFLFRIERFLTLPLILGGIIMIKDIIMLVLELICNAFTVVNLMNHTFSFHWFNIVVFLIVLPTSMLNQIIMIVYKVVKNKRVQ